MDIKIEPEQIDQFVRDAILKSALGAAISKAVVAAISGHSSPVDGAVKDFVGLVAREIIAAEYRPAVEEAVRKHLAEKVNEELIGNITSKLCDKMTSNSY